MREFRGGKLLGKQGQYIAFITLVMIFIFITLVFTFADSISRALTVDEDTFQLVQRENNRIGNTLLQPGYPTNWNDQNVERIGLTTNNRLNQSKINKAKATDYNEFQNLLGANYDVHINISAGQTGSFQTIGRINSDADIIVTTTRKVIDTSGKARTLNITSSSP